MNYRKSILLISCLTLCVGAIAKDKPGKPNNWGTWGKDDQLGAVNYLEPKHIVKAAKLIKEGKVFSLAIPLDATGPVFPSRSTLQFWRPRDFRCWRARLSGFSASTSAPGFACPRL